MAYLNIRKILTIIFAFIVFAVVFILGMYFDRKFYPYLTVLGSCIELAKTPLVVLTKNIPHETLTVPGNDEIKIVAPKKGEILCLGKEYTVKWEVPERLEKVTLKIAGGAPVSTIGYFPSGYEGKELGKGQFRWLVGYNRENTKIVPGPAYKIYLESTYANYGIGNFSEMFTITNCK